jgi:hypothetical protein
LGAIQPIPLEKSSNWFCSIRNVATSHRSKRLKEVQVVRADEVLRLGPFSGHPRGDLDGIHEVQWFIIFIPHVWKITIVNR